MKSVGGVDQHAAHGSTPWGQVWQTRHDDNRVAITLHVSKTTTRAGQLFIEKFPKLLAGSTAARAFFSTVSRSGYRSKNFEENSKKGAEAASLFLDAWSTRTEMRYRCLASDRTWAAVEKEHGAGLRQKVEALRKVEPNEADIRLLLQEPGEAALAELRLDWIQLGL